MNTQFGLPPLPYLGENSAKMAAMGMLRQAVTTTSVWLATSYLVVISTAVLIGVPAIALYFIVSFILFEWRN